MDEECGIISVNKRREAIGPSASAAAPDPAPRGDSEGRKAGCWPQTAEVHVRARDSISPDSCIFPNIEKHQIH